MALHAPLANIFYLFSLIISLATSVATATTTAPITLSHIIIPLIL